MKPLKIPVIVEVNFMAGFFLMGIFQFNEIFNLITLNAFR